jgi:hypothetical protein
MADAIARRSNAARRPETARGYAANFPDGTLGACGIVRVAYFTAGTVGAGHLVRGVALGRALVRRGFAGTYRAFGPRLPYPSVQDAGFESVAVVEDELRDPSRAATSGVAAALAAFRPDLLVVDMFWAPLRHILPLPDCECWLLVRACPRAWFTGPRDTSFAPAQFRRVVAIEPFRHAAVRETVDPIVVCNPDECRPPGALRERLGVPPERSLVVVAHAGLAGERAAIEAEARGEHAVRCDLFDEHALFPLAEWLPGADRVHCGAGYNAFWEARWLGYAPRTSFKPFPRKIDDQAWRVATCLRSPMRANGADTLAGWIVGTSGR